MNDESVAHLAGVRQRGSAPIPNQYRRRACTTFLVIVVALLNVVNSARCDEQVTETPITDADREHWSFRPLIRPTVPVTSDTAWPRNSIDQFVLSKLEHKELRPLPAANRVTLIRRLYFDLLGLPPGPEQVDAFLADSSPAAYERLVEEILASPNYGERWAQHWLDLARFAETDGFEHDKVRKDVWQYRDWVIGALNSDMSYAQFVRLQLAADELEPGKETDRIATAFCLSGPDMPDINSQEERKHNLLNEVTSTVGSVLMGLQFGCAQCHDHKYDPLSLVDFYRLRAIFEPAVQLKKNESISVLREKPGASQVSYVMLRGDWQRRGPQVEPGFPRIVNVRNQSIPAADQSSTSGRRKAFAEWVTRPDHPLTARVIANRIWQHHFGNGLSRTPSDFGIVGDEPTHPELLDWLAIELIDSGWSLKHLHRLIVNSSVYRQPSRLEDSEIPSERSPAMQSNWQRVLELDPANLKLARFPRQRLSGEVIRDAMLTSAGALNSAQGGPGVLPPLPSEIVGMLLKDQWTVSRQAADHYRRSVYVFARRNLRYPIFEVFDRPDANASCPRRPQSTTAPQSLLLLNSELSLDLARRMAGRVLQDAPASVPDQIRLAVRYTMSRNPTAEELDKLSRFYHEHSSLIRQESRSIKDLAMPIPVAASVDSCDGASLTDLCLALFNSSEFIYVD